MGGGWGFSFGSGDSVFRGVGIQFCGERGFSFFWGGDGDSVFFLREGELGFSFPRGKGRYFTTPVSILDF